MKIYGIENEETKAHTGVLLYFEKSGDTVIELANGLDEWTGPLLFSAYLKKHIYTIPRRASSMWVKERVIPPERQNISAILKNHNLQSYDEMKLLELSHGRCCQDSLRIRKLSALPEYAAVRAQGNIRECIVSDAGYLICFFYDGSVKKVNVKSLAQSSESMNVDGLSAYFDPDDIAGISGNHALYMSGRIGPGGYCVTFNNQIDIPARILHDSGESVPLTLDDLLFFVRENVLDTAESCEMLECTRQNISYMIRRDRVSPVKEAVKGNLYLKGDVLANTW